MIQTQPEARANGYLRADIRLTQKSLRFMGAAGLHPTECHTTDPMAMAPNPRRPQTGAPSSPSHQPSLRLTRDEWLQDQQSLTPQAQAKLLVPKPPSTEGSLPTGWRLPRLRPIRPRSGVAKQRSPNSTSHGGNSSKSFGW